MIFLGYNAELYNQVDKFNSIYSVLTPFFHFSFIAENFTIAAGVPKYAFAMSGLSLLLCAVDYAFIKGPLRLNNVFESLALSEVVKTLTYTSVFLLLFKRSEQYQDYGLFTAGFNNNFAKKLLLKSLPIFFQEVFMALKPMILMQFILPDDEILLAANGLFSQIFLMGQIFEKAIGKWLNLALKGPTAEGDYESIIALEKRGFIHLQVFTGILVTSVLLWPESIASFFIDIQNPMNSQILSLYLTVTKLKAADYLFSTFGNITSSALRGVGCMKQVAGTNILTSYAFTLPLTYFLVNNYGFGLWGAVIGSLAGNVINTIILQIEWWSEVHQWNIGVALRETFWGTEDQPSALRWAFNRCSVFFAGFWG